MAQQSSNGLLPWLPQVEWEEFAYASLKMRLDLFDDQVVATKYEQGSPSPPFVVDPEELASRLAGLDLSSGMLPRNCLFWQKQNGQERLAVYVPPQVWGVQVAGLGSLCVPMPGLIFVGHGLEYNIYAVKGHGNGWTPKPNEGLFVAPVPNVWGAQGVCQGNVPFPEASTGTIWQAIGLFFESGFNNHLANGKSQKYGNNILRMWRVLDRAKAVKYPEADLIATHRTVRSLL
jgi:PRTRC genetic system protein B